VSFWDPRDGDLEDDASSTVSKSLLGHAASMLVEISLPKLALAFLSLVVLPAILIGAAPIALAWYARTVAHQVAWGIYLLLAAVLLLAAALIGWRFGKRLFRAAEQNFWSLNAALVQPLYTALREVARRLIEAILPDSRFGAARFAAGLTAGVLIASLAAIVVWHAGPLPTVGVPLNHPRDLWPAALAALGNGAWAVAVYVMLGAPAWSLAELWAGTPRDLDARDFAGMPRWRVAHLSDIHVVGGDFGFRLECGRDGPRGNHRFERVLALLEAEDAQARLDWILVTGDITDAARNEEFIAFDAALARHPALRDRILIIPGNHDVNIVDRANPARLELPIAPGGPVRRLRMLAATARLQGHRVHVASGETLEAHLAAAGRGEALARFMDRGGIRAGQRAMAIWDEVFPMIVPPAGPDGLGVVLLDSNGRTHFSFTNALGIVDATQLKAAEAAMRAWPASRWLVCVHHHLVEYPRPGATLAERIGTALVNGHWVVQRLRRFGARCVVLHGHRHYDWMGACGGLRILSAPSPVMGAMDDGATYFWLHGFGAGEAGALTMAPPRKLVVPPVSGPTAIPS
jgi:predicted MPP superfamily phosphohydrolase